MYGEDGVAGVWVAYAGREDLDKLQPSRVGGVKELVTAVLLAADNAGALDGARL
jgi:hypothetical protein